MDDLFVKLELLQLFVVIFTDACERQDCTYLEKFLHSELAIPALKTWYWIDSKSYNAFEKLLKSVNKYAI